MSGEKIILIAVLAIGCVSAITCPSYTCSTVSGSSCFYSSGTNNYNVTACAKGTQCLRNVTGTNYYCGTWSQSAVPNQGHGAYCNGTTGTYTCRGTCSSNKCVGMKAGSSCTMDLDCDELTFCKGQSGTTNGTCTALLPEKSACTIETNDNDCAHNTECYNSTCTKYYSIANGGSLLYAFCSSGTSNMCASGQCISNSTTMTAMCIEAYKSTKSVPMTCTTSADCTAMSGKTYGTFGTCTCGYSSTQNVSYCSTQLGDSYNQKLLSKTKSWLSSSSVKKCNVMTNPNTCMYAQWGKSDYYDFMYYQYMAENEPLLANAAKCVLHVLQPGYYYLHDKHDSNSLYLAISAVIVSLLA